MSPHKIFSVDFSNSEQVYLCEITFLNLKPITTNEKSIFKLQPLIWDNFAMSAQKWKIIKLPNNYYVLSPACAPDKNLDVKGGFTFNGTTLQIWDSNGSNAQKFIFTKH